MSMYDTIAELPVVDNHTHPLATFFTGVHKTAHMLQDRVSLFSMGHLKSRMPARDYCQITMNKKGFLEYEAELLEYQQFRENTATERLRAEAFRTLRRLKKEETENPPREISSPGSESGTAELHAISYENVFDLLHIKKALVNDNELTLNLPVTLWVPYLDQFVFIKEYEHSIHRKDQQAQRTDRYQTALQNTKQALSADPATFTQYLEFIDAALEHFKTLGCPAVKIHCAYVRSLNFEPVDRPKAQVLFNAPSLNRIEAKTVQDFMMRFSLERCLAHGLAVHVHTGIGGPSPGILLANSNCCHLQNLFLDDRLRQLTFVILHGGYPLWREAGFLASNYANVYLDFSWLTFLFESPLARFLEEWLDLVPYNKLLFGTDAWTPELQWCGVVNGKRMLAQTLDRGSWDKKTALRIARAILHDNAVRLYGL